MSNRPIRLVRHSGLTLIELLVAISILAFVAVLGWRGLDSIVRARIALTGDLEQTRGMQLTFAQLQSDCAHLAPPALLPNRVPLIIEPGRLKLIRTVFSDNQPSRLQVVTYQIKSGVLMRHESAETRDLKELDVLWQQSEIETAQAVVLLSEVTLLDMRLWVSGGWHTGAEIMQLSPAENENPPPGQTAQPPLLTGLEVSMHLKGHDAGLLKIFLLGAV